MPARKKKSTAIATLGPNQITREQANELIRQRSVELFQQAKSTQERAQQEFAAMYGSFDALDQSLLGELQRLQMRFAAVARRQQMQRTSYGGAPEPKVSKFVEQLGAIIGTLSAFLATEHVSSLFERIDESDYVIRPGMMGGRKGYDESVLAGLEIVDELRPLDNRPVHDVESADELDAPCIHVDLEPDEDDPTQLYCRDCDRMFATKEAAGV